MRKIQYKYKPTLIILIWIMLFLTGTIQAQVKTYSEEITVVAAYDPIIPDAFKISENPVISDTVGRVPLMNYSLSPRMAEIKPVIDPLPAVKLVAEPLSKLYRNYIKGGIGNYSTLYGELFMSTLRSKTYQTSLHLKHQSAAGEIENYGPPQNSYNEAVLTGTRFFTEHTLSGKAFYNRDGLNLYGYKPSDYPEVDPKADSIKQRYFNTGASMNFGSNFKAKDKLNHTIGLSYYHMAGMYQNKENSVKFSATIDKQYDLFKIENNQVLGLTAGYDFLNQHDSLRHINSGIFLINPFLKAEINEYSFKVGFKLNIANDTITKGHFFPEAEARLELIPNALKLFVGISGGMERTSLQSVTEDNLFVSSVLPWNYIYDKFKFYGGFQSNISRSFNFNGSISSSTYENYPLFVTDTTAYLLNSFTILYDNINIVKLKAELEFVKTNRLQLALTGSYNFYNTLEQQYAWYKPAYEFGFSGRYDMQNKIVITAKANVNGPVWALVPVEVQYIAPGPKYIMEPEQLKGWVDISLGTEYRFNKSFSAWINFNNITNSKYYNWYNYRSYGLNLLAGVGYSF